MRRVSQIIALLCCSAVRAVADNDDSYIEYLKKNDLKSEECASHAPEDWFRAIGGREKLGYRGTPGHQAETVEIFYAKYLAALQPYNDSHHPEIVKARLALRELFYYVTDSFEDVTRERTYITHARIDAFVEHIIACLAQSGFPALSWDLDFSVEDTASYLRARLLLMLRAAILPPDPDAFRAQVASKLRQIHKKHPIEAVVLNYYLASFADDYQTPLSPKVE